MKKKKQQANTKNERNTNQPTQKKKSFEEEETNQSRRLFVFLYEWMKPRKETQQEKLFEKKKYEKKTITPKFNLQVKGGKETEWQKEQEREREGGGVWLETIQ
jgi:hypothetical protein